VKASVGRGSIQAQPPTNAEVGRAKSRVFRIAGLGQNVAHLGGIAVYAVQAAAGYSFAI